MTVTCATEADASYLALYIVTLGYRVRRVNAITITIIARGQR